MDVGSRFEVRERIVESTVSFHYSAPPFSFPLLMSRPMSRILCLCLLDRLFVALSPGCKLSVSVFTKLFVARPIGLYLLNPGRSYKLLSKLLIYADSARLPHPSIVLRLRPRKRAAAARDDSNWSIRRYFTSSRCCPTSSLKHVS